MPVTPEHIPKFELRPPTTIGDKGEPSDSILKDASRVFAMMDDERHLAAYKLYLNVRDRLNEWWKVSSANSKNAQSHSSTSLFALASGGQRSKKRKKSKDELRHDQEMEEALEFLASQKDRIDKLEGKCRLFRKAQENLSTAKDWLHGSYHFGITTSYRRESDGSMSIKLEGDMNDVPIFEQICVLREVDLHHKWAPFCSCSLTIADLDKLDTVGWFLIGMPHFGITRDACFRAIGCDNFEDDECILVVAHGVKDSKSGDDSSSDNFLSNDPVLDLLDIPPVPKRRGIGRLTIKNFEAMVRIKSPTSASTCIVANIDPNIAFMPQALIDFIIKHLAGVVLAKLQGAAKKIPQNSANNEHAKRMRQEEAFYKGWLMPKFIAHCQRLGWELPYVSAFDVAVESSNGESPRRKGRHSHLDANGGTAMISDSDTASGIESASAGGLSLPTTMDENHSEYSRSSSKTKGLSSVVRRNPISSLIRDSEERHRRKEDAKIADARRLAADRLKPREMPQDKLERLDELRRAKSRRLGSATAALTKVRSSANSNSQIAEITPLTISQQISDKLHAHKGPTRMAVITFLVSAFFTMLQWDCLSLSAVQNSTNQVLISWLPISLADFITFGYLLLCSIMHFILCDIALVYAFSSIELGSKAGRQIKRYYSEKMRVAVAVGSISIMLLSTSKALVRVAIVAVVGILGKVTCVLKELFSTWARRADECASASSERASNLTGEAFQLAHDEFQRARNAIDNIGTYFQLVKNTFYFLGYLLLTVLRSKMFGKSLEYSILSVLAYVLSLGYRMLESLNKTVQNTYVQYENNPSHASWRDDALSTAKVLFSYSSVFLLSLLIVFQISARRSIAPPPVAAVINTSTTGAFDDQSVYSLGNHFSGVSTLGDDQSVYSLDESTNILSSTPSRISKEHAAISSATANKSVNGSPFHRRKIKSGK